MLILAVFVSLIGQSLSWYNHFYVSVCLYGMAAVAKIILIHSLAKKFYYVVSVGIFTDFFLLPSRIEDKTRVWLPELANRVWLDQKELAPSTELIFWNASSGGFFGEASGVAVKLSGVQVVLTTWPVSASSLPSLLRFVSPPAPPALVTPVRSSEVSGL